MLEFIVLIQSPALSHLYLQLFLYVRYEQISSRIVQQYFNQVANAVQVMQLDLIAAIPFIHGTFDTNHKALPSSYNIPAMLGKMQRRSPT